MGYGAGRKGRQIKNEGRSSPERMNAIKLPYPARALLFAAGIGILLPVGAAAAQQTDPADGPLPAPAEAPVSRLTVTPGEFDQWVAKGAPANMPATAADKPEAAPRIASAPPAPTLVTPPAPPKLAAPPAPAPSLAPVPTTPSLTPPPVTMPDAQSKPSASSPPAIAAPPAPALGTSQPPASTQPRVATLPPQAPTAVPPPPVVEPLARPDNLSVLFQQGAMDVPAAAKPDLNRMADWLKQNPGVRVQIVGYASTGKSAESEARRTSLYRTLAVRKYLVDRGVLSTRMDVRAMGSKTDRTPKDRVEISLPPS